MIDLSSSALVSIDVQRDTLDGQPLEVPGTSAAVPAMAAVAAAYRHAIRPIVHVVRLYRADGSNAEPFRRPLVRSQPVLRPGTPGRLLAPQLLATEADLDDDLLLTGGIQELGPSEVAIYKPRWGAFFETPLHGHLRSLAVDTVVFVGCNFPNCPRTSIYEASERDYAVIVVEDGVSGIYDRGRDELIGIGATCRPAAAIIASLDTAARGSTLPAR
jgi:nicotinamidase-related amidase